MRLGKALKRAAHGAWIGMQESGAIWSGQVMEVDPRESGDNYAPSPAVREVYRADYREHTETDVTETYTDAP